MTPILTFSRHSQTATAAISKSDLWPISRLINGHRSRQCAGQRLLCCGGVEFVPSLQVKMMTPKTSVNETNLYMLRVDASMMIEANHTSSANRR